MRGGGDPAAWKMELYSATWLLTESLVRVWFMSVPWSVTPGTLAPSM